MDYLICYSDGSEGYLAHYGVLGMKWGVRHDKEKTAQRVSSYVDKYNKKAMNAKRKALAYDKTIFGRSKSTKYLKYKAKSDRFADKASRATSDKRIASNNKKSLKYQKKAASLTNNVVKAQKYNAKAYKYEFKAKRMQEAYAKELKRTQAKTMKNGKTACYSVLS